jgi:hypothetical protein
MWFVLIGVSSSGCDPLASIFEDDNKPLFFHKMKEMS